jgi:hypothetical protein
VSSNANPVSLCEVTPTETCQLDFGFSVHGGSSNIVFDLVGYFA